MWSKAWWADPGGFQLARGHWRPDHAWLEVSTTLRIHRHGDGGCAIAADIPCERQSVVSYSMGVEEAPIQVVDLQDGVVSVAAIMELSEVLYPETFTSDLRGQIGKGHRLVVAEDNECMI